METKDLVIDQRSQGKVVEQISETFPHVCIPIFPKAFIVEPIHLRNLTRFMIATEDCNALRVSDLESNKKGDGLD